MGGWRWEVEVQLELELELELLLDAQGSHEVSSVFAFQ